MLCLRICKLLSQSSTFPKPDFPACISSFISVQTPRPMLLRLIIYSLNPGHKERKAQRKCEKWTGLSRRRDKVKTEKKWRRITERKRQAELQSAHRPFLLNYNPCVYIKTRRFWSQQCVCVSCRSATSLSSHSEAKNKRSSSHYKRWESNRYAEASGGPGCTACSLPLKLLSVKSSCLHLCVRLLWAEPGQIPSP